MNEAKPLLWKGNEGLEPERERERLKMSDFPGVQGYQNDPTGIHYLQRVDSVFVQVMGYCGGLQCN